MNHTPGPWRLEDDGGGSYVIESTCPSRVFAQWCRENNKSPDDSGFGTSRLANISVKYNGSGSANGPRQLIGSDEVRANAHLVVATPDMLEALLMAQRLIKEALPKFNWGASMLDANAITLLNEVPGVVNAAIAKATKK